MTSVDDNSELLDNCFSSPSGDYETLCLLTSLVLFFNRELAVIKQVKIMKIVHQKFCRAAR